MRFPAIVLALTLGFFPNTTNTASAADLEGAQANLYATDLLGLSLPNQIVALGPLRCSGEAPPANARWWHVCWYGGPAIPRYAGVFWRAAEVPGTDVHNWVFSKMLGKSTGKPLGCTATKFFLGGFEFSRQDCQVEVDGLVFAVSFAHGNGITLYVRDSARQATPVDSDFAELLAGVAFTGKRMARP
jgi:hypothetical protein